MSATTSPEDKFAFLFKTNNVSNYDLTQVRDTLEDYYGFPSSNITESTGCANLMTDFEAFATNVIAHPPNGKVSDSPTDTQKNTVFVFIVGNATPGSSGGLTDGTDSITWSDLGYFLDPVPPGPTSYYNNSEVHFYFIFPCFTSFFSNASTGFLLNSSVSYPVTNNPDTFSAHGTFITQWKESFQDNVSSLFDTNKMVTVSSVATRLFSLYSVSPSTINTFYKQYIEGSPQSSPFSPYYPGRPSPEIDDGNPIICKTKDVWLNDLNPDVVTDYDLYDNYLYDTSNKISVRVRIRGTHPVNSYYVGVGVFRSGGGGGCDTNPNPDTAVVPASLLLPGDVQEYSYTYTFPSTYSHRCIKARVNLTGITIAEIQDEPGWSIVARENEVQLNIDPTPVGGGGGGGGGAAPAPGTGTADEADPAAAAEPAADDTGSKSTANLRGYFEHVYLIKNRFKKTLKFRYKIPDIIRRSEHIFHCRWFLLDKKNPEKMIELRYNRMADPWFTLTLRPEEEVEIMTYLALRKKAAIKDRIDIPFDILVEKTGKNFFLRLPIIRTLRNEFQLWSGVNIVLSIGSGDILVRVLDEKKNPVPEAFVFIKTLNGRQSAVCKTNKEGTCLIRNINPGPYKLWAKKDNWKSGMKVVNLHNKKTEKVELVPELKEK
jgi:hypothetical protein